MIRYANTSVVGTLAYVSDAKGRARYENGGIVLEAGDVLILHKKLGDNTEKAWFLYSDTNWVSFLIYESFEERK